MAVYNNEYKTNESKIEIIWLYTNLDTTQTRETMLRSSNFGAVSK